MTSGHGTSNIVIKSLGGVVVSCVEASVGSRRLWDCRCAGSELEFASEHTLD